MASINTLIDFLMGLMRDEETKREFERDPDGTLGSKGLQDVTAQDVQDARLIMADNGSAQPRSDGGSQPSGYHEGSLSSGGSGAVREILHTTNAFEIDQSRHIDQTNITIDNRDTTIIDSFNSQDEVTAIQDNDTINNDVDVINVEDSFNDETDEPGESDEPGDPAESEEPVEAPSESDDPATSGPAADPEDGEVSIQPVEPGPEDVPFDAEPEASIQPVEEDPLVDGEPDLVDSPVA
ncbi:MAG TPA: IniB N-terminal domain-containing protein [Nocardioidaceae bacterium]|nr:IniB N-terminal domain-containing protein [Nocardioidaceae bacterium]